MLKISEISLIPTKNNKGLTFFASFVLNSQFYIGNIALISRLDGSGFRCVYPTKVLSNGTQVPIFYPINRVIGKAIENTLSNEAKRLMQSPEARLRGKYLFGLRDKEDDQNA